MHVPGQCCAATSRKEDEYEAAGGSKYYSECKRGRWSSMSQTEFVQND